MSYVAPLGEFDCRDGQCTVCARYTAIIAARSFDADTTDRLTDLVTGTVQYRGRRIDLLSYRVSEGWRPFVLIKGAINTSAPQAPSVMWSIFPTKAEADAEALQAAKDWIDKITV